MQTTPRLFLKNIFLSLVLLSCAACSNYSLLFNNNLLYEPPALYRDVAVADTNLKNCLLQNIEDNGINSPRQLIQLQCSYAGITNLEGLAKFSRIERLSLKGNPLQNIDAIFTLVNLQILDVSETNLDCGAMQLLKGLPLDQLIGPAECREP